MPLSKDRKAEYDKQRYLERKLGSEKLGLGSEKEDSQPKYEQCYLYSDGRVRLADMTVVEPKQCKKIT